MEKRGWDQCDFVYVCGDAYVDHPSFGSAIISRVLESYGYKVGIIAQPDWKDKESIQILGRPRLGFLVSAGNMDSMVNHYSVSKRRRDKDDNTQPEKIASAIRQHWSIENNLHWQLDVTFREDYSKKVKNAARNFSVATKMALTILKNEKTTKGSMNLKRLKAGWDEKYLSQLLQENNF